MVMPLPPALVERLKRRGLMNKNTSAYGDGEEVYAENYDEEGKRKPEKDSMTNELLVHDEQSGYDYLLHRLSRCPNKANPYHKCVDYCFQRWGEIKFEPDPISLKRRLRMLNRYPLPAGWFEVADPSTGRFYYWNLDTDKVSWLAPLHPRSKMSKSDSCLRQEMTKRDSSYGTYGLKSSSHLRDNRSDSSSYSRSRSVSSNDDDDDDDGDDRRKGGESGRRSLSHRDRRRRSLDPMDPASYSDIPRGSWMSGMDQRGKAKTGVDSTASGPLFQQRPYPSPGDVLRQNKQLRN